MLEIDQKIMSLQDYCYAWRDPFGHRYVSREIKNAFWYLAKVARGRMTSATYDELRAAVLEAHPVLAACPWLHDHSDIPDE